MFPSAEHPYCPHRNAIGLQRAVDMKITMQRVAELRVLGYDVDADRLSQELQERWAAWDSDAD